MVVLKGVAKKLLRAVGVRGDSTPLHQPPFPQEHQANEEHLANEASGRSDTPQLHPSIVVNGKYTYGLEFIRIYEWGEGSRLHVGSFNSIASDQSVFLGGNHRTDWLTTYPFGHIFTEQFPGGLINGLRGHPTSKGDIIIKNDVWIGFGCTIMGGITIGNGSVLAAKSVVSKDVPDYAIVGGNPAKVLKYRFADEVIQLLLEIAWWDEDDSIINAIVPSLQSVATLEDVKKIQARIEALKQKGSLDVSPSFEA